MHIHTSPDSRMRFKWLSRLPPAQYAITSRTLPSGASVTMPYTTKMFLCGCRSSSSNSLRSLSIADVFAQLTPLAFTATSM